MSIKVALKDGHKRIDLYDLGGEDVTIFTHKVRGLSIGQSNVQPYLQMRIPGEGWKDLDISEYIGRELTLTVRIDLARDTVRELIPILQHYVDTGSLPDEVTEIKDSHE